MQHKLSLALLAIGVLLVVAGIALYFYPAQLTITNRTGISGTFGVGPVSYGQPVRISCRASQSQSLTPNPQVVLQNSTGNALFPPISCSSTWTTVTYTPVITDDLFANANGNVDLAASAGGYPYRDLSYFFGALSVIVLALSGYQSTRE